MTPRKISFLLVDDDMVNNFLTKEFLEIYVPEAETYTALNGKEALDFLLTMVDTPENLPDIILLDINMPVLDGWEFLDKLESLKNPILEKLNIYMFTSSVYYKDIDKSKTYASVKNIFSKPLTEEIIHKMLNEISFTNA